MIRCVSGDQPKQWDATLPQIEFAFNSTMNRSTGMTPFEIVYTYPPQLALDLAPLPKHRSREHGTKGSEYSDRGETEFRGGQQKV